MPGCQCWLRLRVLGMKSHLQPGGQALRVRLGRHIEVQQQCRCLASWGWPANNSGIGIIGSMIHNIGNGGSSPRLVSRPSRSQPSSARIAVARVPLHHWLCQCAVMWAPLQVKKQCCSMPELMPPADSQLKVQRPKQLESVAIW